MRDQWWSQVFEHHCPPPPSPHAYFWDIHQHRKNPLEDGCDGGILPPLSLHTLHILSPSTPWEAPPKNNKRKKETPPSTFTNYREKNLTPPKAVVIFVAVDFANLHTRLLPFCLCLLCVDAFLSFGFIAHTQSHQKTHDVRKCPQCCVEVCRSSVSPPTLVLHQRWRGQSANHHGGHHQPPCRR